MPNITPFLIDTKHLSHECKTENFFRSIVRADHKGRNCGVAAIFLHNFFATDANDVFYCETMSLYNKTNDIAIIAFYSPPRSLQSTLKNVSRKSGHLTKKYKPRNIIMMVDFNLLYVNWPTNILDVGTRIPTPDRAATELHFNLIGLIFHDSKCSRTNKTLQKPFETHI